MLRSYLKYTYIPNPNPKLKVSELEQFTDFLCHHRVNILMAQILSPKLKSVIMNCISVTYRDSFVPSKVPDTRVNFHFVIYFFFSIYEKMFIEFTNYFLYINLLGKCNNFLPQHRHIFTLHI